MNVYLEYYSYLALVLVAFFTSIYKIETRQREDIILSLLLLLTFISELIALLLTKKYRNNLIVYHFFNPIQFMLISFYFNEVIRSFKQKNIGIYIGLFGLLISAFNSLLIQSISQLNNYYLLFEGIAIIAMILHFFYTTIHQDSQVLFKNKHIWIGMIFLLFWSATYSFWALSNAIMVEVPEYMLSIACALQYVNYITYGGLSLVFILNKKQILHNGH